MLTEDLIKTEVGRRTPVEKKIIRLKRILAIFISLLILILGWLMIAAGSIYESAMQDYFLAETGNAFIGEWSATLVMTFVNYFIPWLISQVD
jgi:ammonia channel protein AmtB